MQVLGQTSATHIGEMKLLISLHTTAAPAVRAGSQNWADLPRKDMKIVIFFPLNKNKENAELRWPLLKVNLRSIILPGDSPRTTSELPCRTLETHFWLQFRSLETKNVSYFSLFQYNLKWLKNLEL